MCLIMKIVILNNSFFTEKHIERLRALGEVVFYQTTNTEKEAIKRLQGADIALVDAFIAPINAKVLQAVTNVKLIALNTTTFSMVDSAVAREKGIHVANIPGFSKESVAELAIGLLFSLSRHIIRGDARVRSHPIDDLDPASDEGKSYIGFELKGKTMGILGLGRIGGCVSQLAQGLGMNVIAHNRTEKIVSGVQNVSFEELFKKSDVVSVHLPLTSETQGIIGIKEFDLMKKTAVIVNLAPPACIETEALYLALKNGKIRGAALDLVANVDENHPIFKLDNVIFTPHIGSYTEEAFLTNMPEMVVSNVEAFVAGKPQNIVI